MLILVESQYFIKRCVTQKVIFFKVYCVRNILSQPQAYGLSPQRTVNHLSVLSNRSWNGHFLSCIWFSWPFRLAVVPCLSPFPQNCITLYSLSMHFPIFRHFQKRKTTGKKAIEAPLHPIGRYLWRQTWDSDYKTASASEEKPSVWLEQPADKQSKNMRPMVRRFLVMQELRQCQKVTPGPI